MPQVTSGPVRSRCEWSRRVVPILASLALVLAGAAVASAQKIPADFPMPRAETSPGLVMFSHASHARVGKCTACHAKDFRMKRGASGPITLEAKQEGKYCGRCHDGKTRVAGALVFGIDECDRCHKDTPAAAQPAPTQAGADARTSKKAAGNGRAPSAGVARAKTSTAKTGEPPKSEDCLACHGDTDLRRATGSTAGGASVFVDAKTLEGSRHAGLDCVGCHVTATIPHGAKLPRVDCRGCHEGKAEGLKAGVHGRPRATRAGARATTCAACHGSHGIRDPQTLGTDTCATCHQPQVALYRDSIHGRARARGDTEAATCRSCHGAAHAIVPKTDPRALTYHLNLPRTCAQCHGDPELARRHNIEVGDVYRLFMDSIHGRAITRSGLLVAANCSDCHGAHDIKPRTDPTSRVSRANVPTTCGGCHAGVLKQYRQSIHGQAVASGDKQAPICIDCHSAHRIRRVETETWKLDIVRECGTCHKESLRTYRDTFHGKVTALGFTRVARCSDCHGAHDIYPVRDVKSSVNPGNRVATCGKCHAAANENFARYDPHAEPENPGRSPLLYYTWKFMVWLLVGTFSFFGVHTVLWGVRSLVARNGGNHRGAPPSDGRDEEKGDA